MLARGLAGSKLERFLNQQSISLRVDDELLVIPMHQIKSTRFSPVQDQAIKGVMATVSQLCAKLAI